MHDICVIGDRDSVLGFKTLGFTAYPVENAYEAERIIAKISDRYAVIFVTEQILQDIPATIEIYRDRKLPAIIPVPGSSGSTGIGMRTIRDAMERAVGADILFKQE